jgi:hypothetical protein
MGKKLEQPYQRYGSLRHQHLDRWTKGLRCAAMESCLLHRTIPITVFSPDITTPDITITSPGL